MRSYALVCLGASLGASLRYFISQYIQNHWGHNFPWSTLVVNSSGCFLMGIIGALLLTDAISMPETIKPLFVIGLLGSFTTFSAFTFDTQQLVNDSKYGLSLINVGLNIGICWISLWSGDYLIRLWLR